MSARPIDAARADTPRPSLCAYGEPTPGRRAAPGGGRYSFAGCCAADSGDRWRGAAQPLGIAPLTAGDLAAVDASERASSDVMITTHLVLAALIEAALLAATDPEPGKR